MHGEDADVSQAADAGAGTADATTDGESLPLGPVVDDRYEAGTRLTPSFFEMSGERRFIDWYDAELRVHCTFRKLAGGELRCMPVALPAGIVPSLFADPGCTKPVARVDSPIPCAAIPPVAAVVTGCNTRIFRTEPARANFAKSSGQCGIAYNVAGFTLGAEIPPSSWVRGTLEESTEDTGPAVRAELVRGEDGSSGFFRWSPRTLDTECTWSRGSAPELRCLPRAAVGAVAFTDSACTTSMFMQGDACAPPVVGVRATRRVDRCITRTTATDYFALGGAYSGKTFLATDDGGCAPSDNLAGRASGARLDPEATFGVAEELRVQTSGRLAATFARLPSGVRARLGWFDPVLGSACAIGAAIDGSWRCLPAAPMIETTAWTDPACSMAKPAAYVAPDRVISCQPMPATCPSDCALPEKPAFVAAVDRSGGLCVPDRRRIYEVGDVAPAPIWIRPELAAATCREANRRDEVVYDVRERAATELVAATPTIP